VEHVTEIPQALHLWGNTVLFITQVCSGKIVFKISTFHYGKTVIKISTFFIDFCVLNLKKFYHVPLFNKTNISFQGLFTYIHRYWTINATWKTSFMRFHQARVSLSHFLPSFIDKQNTVHPVQRSRRPCAGGDTPFIMYLTAVMCCQVHCCFPLRMKGSILLTSGDHVINPGIGKK
jgi:hypothetical protein